MESVTVVESLVSCPATASVKTGTYINTGIKLKVHISKQDTQRYTQEHKKVHTCISTCMYRYKCQSLDTGINR